MPIFNALDYGKTVDLAIGEPDKLVNLTGLEQTFLINLLAGIPWTESQACHAIWTDKASLTASEKDASSALIDGTIHKLMADAIDNCQPQIEALNAQITALNAQIANLESDITTTFTGSSVSNFSVSFWCKANTTTDYDILRMNMSIYTVVLYSVSGLKYNNTTRATIEPDEWVFWQITRASGVVKSYKNAIAIGNDMTVGGGVSDIVLKKKSGVLISNIRFSLNPTAITTPPTRE